MDSLPLKKFFDAYMYMRSQLGDKHMPDGMVMRSVYLRPQEDTKLRQLAHEKNVSKNDLIRSAVAAKLREWEQANSDERLNEDLALGRRTR